MTKLTLLQRVDSRDLLRELARRLVGLTNERPALRSHAIAPLMEEAISALDAVVSALADDPSEGELSRTIHACPACDNDTDKCRRGGNCALDPDPSRRPEPYDALTLLLPRQLMNTVKEAVKIVRRVAGDEKKSPSSALALVALDFTATHDWRFRKPKEQVLRLLFETFEHALGLTLVVTDKKGKLLYGADNFVRLLKTTISS